MASTSVNRQAVHDACEGMSDLDVLDLELQPEARLELLPLARQKRNARTAACLLPPEILTAVFSYLQAGWWPSTKTGRRERYGAGWMVVAKVCSFWRQVVLGTPSLWCELDCLSFHPQSVEEVISRSRALPLSLRIIGSASRDDLVSWLCSSVTPRVRKLIIAGGSRADLFGWIELLYAAMPLLTELHIAVTVHSSDPTPNFLPTAFLGGTRPPHLRVVFFTGLMCAWDSSPVSLSTSPSLSDLVLYGSTRAQIIPPSQVVSTLASLVNIHRLALFHILPNEIHTNARRDPIPVPPKLRDLDLRAASRYSASIPAFLDQFPAWAASDINLCARFKNPDDAILDATLPRLFSPHHSLVVRPEMFLSREAISIVYLREEPSPSQWATKLVLSQFPLIAYDRQFFERNIDTRKMDPDRTLVSKLPLLNLAELRALHVTSDAAAGLRGERAWTQCFASATKVDRVAGFYADLHDLICALRVIEDSGPSDREGSFALFPALEVLVFHAKPTKDTRSITENADAPEEHDIQESTFAENNAALIDLLAARDARGRPVKDILVDEAMSGWDLWEMPALRDTTHIWFF
ncbi:unnamed protein product [Peniophora sp. CBMAI 1063]|nr:unnamed protein product [Peniophora sp. CBMAI 1063]